jgi:hypothetical protein
MGLFWFKGQSIGTGQANIKHYNRHLRNLIHAGRAKPSWIISSIASRAGTHGLPTFRRPRQWMDESCAKASGLILTALVK